jgi:hypothetical protein
MRSSAVRIRYEYGKTASSNQKTLSLIGKEEKAFSSGRKSFVIGGRNFPVFVSYNGTSHFYERTYNHTSVTSKYAKRKIEKKTSPLLPRCLFYRRSRSPNRDRFLHSPFQEKNGVAFPCYWRSGSKNTYDQSVL